MAGSEQPARGMPVVEALEVLVRLRGPADVVITNQASARVWPQISQHGLDLAYNPSTMGGAVPLGLGLAIAQPARQVIVVSGDGALLMSLGSLVSVIAAEVTNLTIVVLDNGLYEVTGGQKTPAAGRPVDLAAIACGAGFRTAAGFTELAGWQAEAEHILTAAGPRFINLQVQPTPGDFFLAKGPVIVGELARLRAALG
jgi:sulfopyruvate decarboxylase subunit beta